MDFSQELVTTLHDLSDPTPEAPLANSSVVVPIAGSSIETVTPDHVMEILSSLSLRAIVVPLRAPANVVSSFREWINTFDLDVTVLWCNSDAVEKTLTSHGLDGDRGKGRDVWLGLGVAAKQADYVAVHDADASTFTHARVPRLLAPLDLGSAFVKGYYARVEDGRLYGRLNRLFIAPLLRALSNRHDARILRYYESFRYPLAGEFAITSDLVQRIRLQRTWGLEIGLLGEAYRLVGPERIAQVDLGVHTHDHHPVSGETGLAKMATEVGAALFHSLEAAGIDLDYDAVEKDFLRAADELIQQYAADAAFNGLTYDEPGEREQSRIYQSSIEPPGSDTRLPAWKETTLTPSDIVAASNVSITEKRGRQTE